MLALATAEAVDIGSRGISTQVPPSFVVAVVLVLVTVVVGGVAMLTLYHRIVAGLKQTIAETVNAALALRFAQHETDEEKWRRQFHAEMHAEVESLRREVAEVKGEVTAARSDIRALADR